MIRSMRAITVVAALATVSSLTASCGKPGDSLPSVVTAADTAAAGSLITTAALARVLADSTQAQPAMFHVGFQALYRSSHIPRSSYAGPASKPEGIAALEAALRAIPRKQAVVLYCGCCPWIDCPNVRPAYRAACSMGFQDVRVLYVPKNFPHDWARQGLAVTSGP